MRRQFPTPLLASSRCLTGASISEPLRLGWELLWTLHPATVAAYRLDVTAVAVYITTGTEEQFGSVTIAPHGDAWKVEQFITAADADEFTVLVAAESGLTRSELDAFQRTETFVDLAPDNVASIATRVQAVTTAAWRPTTLEGWSFEVIATLCDGSERWVDVREWRHRLRHLRNSAGES